MAKKIVSFEDYNKEAEKSDLKKVSRNTIKNDAEMKQVPGNRTHVFNKVTRKIDDLSPAEINDKIDSIEESLNGDIVEEAKELASKIEGNLDPRILAHNIHHNPQDFSEVQILSYFIYFMNEGY